VPLKTGEDEDYMLALKQELRETVKRLPYFIEPPEEKQGTHARQALPEAGSSVFTEGAVDAGTCDHVTQPITQLEKTLLTRIVRKEKHLYFIVLFFFFFFLQLTHNTLCLPFVIQY
jgi:hypothetical protein